MIENISEWFAGLAGKTDVGNALTPTVKLTAISLIVFAYVTGSGNSMPVAYDVLLLSPLGLSLVQIIFFTFTNPERLQSEWYNLRQQELTQNKEESPTPMPAGESVSNPKENGQ